MKLIFFLFFTSYLNNSLASGPSVDCNGNCNNEKLPAASLPNVDLTQQKDVKKILSLSHEVIYNSLSDKNLKSVGPIHHANEDLSYTTTKSNSIYVCKKHKRVSNVASSPPLLQYECELNHEEIYQTLPKGLNGMYNTDDELVSTRKDNNFICTRTTVRTQKTSFHCLAK